MRYIVLLIAVAIMIMGIAFATPNNPNELRTSQKLRILDDVLSDLFSSSEPVEKYRRSSRAYSSTMGGNQSEVYENTYQLLLSTGWNSRDVPRMMQHITCESSFDPTALNVNKNGSEDRGLLQVNLDVWGGLINSMGYTPDDMYKPEPNARVSHAIYYEKQGIGAWKATALCAMDRKRQASLRRWFRSRSTT